MAWDTVVRAHGLPALRGSNTRSSDLLLVDCRLWNENAGDLAAACESRRIISD